MFTPRSCGCKGVRTCLVCEREFDLKSYEEQSQVWSHLDNKECFEYCHLCGDKAWKGVDVWKEHETHHDDKDETKRSFPFEGILLVPDFLTPEEEGAMITGCDSLQWDLSQSGRRKQNFGPKTNFKRRKISGKGFTGFPKFSQFAQRKLSQVPLLADFQTIEQCSIEYRPEKGASIDPHIDDCWIWGERVISVNLISDSVLTMRKYVGDEDKYNLNHHYSSDPKSKKAFAVPQSDNDFPIVRIPMPARSLLVLFGPARYEWEHCILRRDITDRRICMAYREFTKEYLNGGKLFESMGKPIYETAMNFWDNSQLD